MPRNDLIQIRHGTQSEWATINPILASGEGGIDISSNIFKVGDGQSSWVDLHQIGGENLYYVKNDEGSVILAGQCVYAKGAVGNSNSIKAGLFIGNGTIPEYAVMGLAKTNIGIGEFGYVSAFGTISAIDTYPNGNITNLANANEYWEEGTILYASPITAGKLTSIKPAHDTILAIVLKRNNNGKLFVRPSWNPHLDDLHDVDTANYSDGKFLQYSLASGLWIPSSTGNFTSLFVNSVRVSVSGHTHSVSDISGLESLVPSNVVFTTGNQSISGIKVFNNLVQIGSPLNSDAGILNVYSNDGSDIASEINLKNSNGVNRLSITANDDTATSMIEASNVQLDLTNRDGAIRIFTKDNFSINIPISGSGGYYQNFSVTDGKVQVGTNFRSGELSVIGSGNFSNSLLVGDSNGLLINNNSITTSSGNNIKIYTAPSGGLYVGPNYIDLNENPSPYNVQILAETSIGTTSMIRCLESGIGIGGFSYDITSDPIYIDDSAGVVAGRFTSLEVNNVPVSVSGHAHNAIDIIDFNSSVSGLLPSISGTGFIETIFENNIYRIGVTGLQLTGDYVSLTGYEDISGTKTFLNDVVVSGQFSSVSGYFQDYLSLNGSGVSITGHSHIVSDITDFNSGVSGIIPVVTGTGSIEVKFDNNTYTINVTGLPLTGHRHPYTDIDNFCTGVADCVDTPLLAGTGIVLSFVSGTGLYIHFTGGSFSISNTGISAISGYFRDYLSLNGTGVSITGHTHQIYEITNLQSTLNNKQPTGVYVSLTGIESISGTKTFLNNVIVTGQFSSVSGYFKDYLSLNGTGVSITGHSHQIYQITNLQSSLDNKQPTGVYVSLTGIESVTGIKTFINNIVATGGLSSTSGYFKDYLSLNGSGVSLTGHTHTISSITNFNSGVSGLLPTGTANYLSKFGNGGSGLSNSLFFDNGTNVGIGTASPASDFHISAALNANYGNILVSGTNTSTHIGLGGASDTVPFLSSLSAGNIATSVYGFGMFYRNTEGDFALSRKTGSTSWIRCLNIQRSNGNVGIGSGVQATTVPERLTVDGNIRVADTSVTQGNIVQFNRGGGGQYDYSIGKYNPALAISLANDSSSQRPLQVGFHSGTTFLPRFHVNGYTGAVGINTTTPSGYLDVAGDVFIRGNPGTAGRINFKSSTFADTLLNIRSDTGGNIYMDAGGAAIKCGSQDGQIDVRGFSTNVQIGHTYNAGTIAQHVRFTPGGSELMRMTNSGTMGIGLPLTSNLFNIQPFNNCRLHIMGSGADSSSSALNVANSGNSSLLFVRNDGNIGIRTNTPTSQLHIIGSGIFTSGLNVIGLLTSNSGNFTDSLQVNGTGVWHSGNFDNTNIVRTTGTQIISGEKDFGGNLKISAINTTSADFFPTFGSNDPSSTSRTLQYITKQNLVNALSFEQVDLGNSFVNTTGTQQISGVKTFLGRIVSRGGITTTGSSFVSFNGNDSSIQFRDNRLSPLGNINLENDTTNFIFYKDVGTGLPPTNSTVFSSGSKIIFKTMPSVAAMLPPVAIGLSNNSLWNVVPASNWKYEWNAGSGNLATLSGNGMLSVFSGIFTRNGIFTNGITSGSGNFTNSLQVNGTGVSLTNHSHSSFPSLTLGGSSVPLTNFLNIDVPSGFSLQEYQDTNVFSINNIEDANIVFAVDGKGKITYGSIDTANVNNFNDTVTSLLPTIANSGNNRILTSTGDSVGINAESNLTFDGDLLSITGSGNFSNSLTVNNNVVWHSGNFDSSNIARTIGAQAISGYKTFNNRVTVASNLFPGGVQESQILLNGSTNNRIEFNASGVGDPSLFFTSNGKKIVLHPSRSTGAAEDFSIGIAGDGSAGAGTPTRFWQTIKDSSSRFQWYAAATNIATLTGSGIFSTTGGLFSGDVTASGSFVAGSGSAANPSFEFVGDTDTGMFAPAANTIALATSGVERLRINNVGNVGIGTTSPTSRLQVIGLITSSSGNFTDSLQINGTGVWHGGNFDNNNIVRTTGTQTVNGSKTFGNQTSFTSGIVTENISSNTDLILNSIDLIELNLSNGAEGGSIGVVYDVANKNQQFQLYDAASENAILVVTDRTSIVCPNTESSGTYFPVFIQNPNAGTSAILSRTASQLKGDIGLANVSVSGHSHSSSDITNFNSSVSGLLPTGTANYLSKFGTGGSGLSNSLVFDNGTNVGIGLTNPAEKLDVLGNIKVAGANTSLTIAQDDTTTMRMRSAGNLIVAAGSAANVRFLISTTEHARLSDQGRFGIGLSAPSGKLGVAGGVTVGTNYNVTPPTNGMIVEGNVGIGTSSPSYKLDVAGDAEFGSNNWLKLIDTGSNNGRLVFSNIGSIDSSGAFLFRNNAGTTEHMRITTGGNVGIGTTAPSARLEVGGDVNVGYSNENINRTITVHSSNVSNKAGKIRHDGSSFIIDYSIANQGFSLGTSANRWINGIAYYGGSHLFYGNNGSNTILTINSSTSGVSIGSGYNVSTPTNGLIVQGNVGIGTSNPLAKLEVAGTGLFNGLNISNQTADTIAGFDGTKNLVSLPTGTYPSLTELSYVKGLTSAVQTQINSKQNTLIDPVIGTGISNHIAYWTSSSGIAADSGQLYWDSINHRLGIGTEAPISTLQVSGLITSDSGTFGNLLLSSNTLSSITGNIVINPSTSGSLQRDAGGNTRGIYAVDWQSARSTGTMVAAGTHSVICGGQNNSTAGNRSVVCGGNNNSAVGIASSIGGGNTNTTWGVRSTIGGGTLNTTYTENATIGGGSNNTANGLTATIGGGNLNAASGDGSTIAGGSNNSSFGGGSIVGGGNSNSADGYRSSIIGGSNNTTSTKLSSIIGGDGGKTTKSYEVAHSAGAFANAGDAQHTILIAKQTTTTNTAINLFIDTAERLTIPAKTTWTFDIKLSAYNDTDNLGAGWNIRGCLRRNNNNSTVLIGTNVVNQWSEAAMTGTIATALAGDANEALQIQVNGLSGKNIRWVAVVDISQVSYGPI